MRARPYRGALVVGAAALGIATCRLARRLARVEVTGDSMRPALEPGDRLLVLRRRAYRPGAVVAVPDPRDARRLLVKRVARVRPDGRLEVVGDAPAASTDSRTFGPVRVADVRGQAVRRYAPAGRAGPVPGAHGGAR